MWLAAYEVEGVVSGENGIRADAGRGGASAQKVGGWKPGPLNDDAAIY